MTDVAPENPVSHASPEFLRNRSFQFNGEVRNTATCVHGAVRDNRIGGTRFNATGAGAAIHSCEGSIWSQREIHEQFREEKPRTLRPVDEVGVLAKPAQPSMMCQLTLKQWTGVHTRAVLPVTHPEFLLNAVGQFPELGTEDLVVVIPPRIATHPPQRWIVGLHRVRVIRLVVHSKGNEGLRLRKQVPGILLELGMPLQILHCSGITLTEPILINPNGSAGGNLGKSNQTKTKFLGFLANPDFRSFRLCRQHRDGE